MFLDGSGTGNIEKATRDSGDDCRDACSVDDDCQGYDFNANTMECWLDTLVGPSNPAIEGQYFCSKLCKYQAGVSFVNLLFVTILYHL